MGTKYSTPRQRQERASRVKQLESIKADSQLFSGVPKKREFLEDLNNEKTMLEQETPPTITDEKQFRDSVAREQELADAIVHGDTALGYAGMNSIREQEEVPVGAVGAELRWRQFVQHHTVDRETRRIRRIKEGERDMVSEWKDLCQTNYPDEAADNPDISNIERLRPPDREGDSRFILYRRAQFAPGARMSFDQYNEATGHEPSKLEAAVAESEAEGSAKVPSPERLYGPAQVCIGVTKSGKPCTRSAKPGLDHCGLKAHAAQSESKDA